ncbi:MAG: cupin domain-containing protein [Candidatus Acidiferrales bacterium]
MNSDFSLDKKFWHGFTKRCWKQKPTVIRAPFRNSIVTPPEVFQAVIKAGQRLGEPTDDHTLLIGKRRFVMPKDLDRWLPRAKDVSLERYHARLKRAGINEEFAINVTDFQVELGWNFFCRLRQFLKGLYEIAGVPPHAEIDLFSGNYRQTPAGVHRDSAEVFCFVVDGTKRIRAWPANAIRSASPRKGPEPYKHHLKRSICLEGKAGDIIYWPSSYWHIAESDGRSASSLSVGLYYGSSIFLAVARTFELWSHEILGQEDDPLASIPFSPRRVPPQIASTAKRVEGQPGRLTRRLMREWMERITGYGFTLVPLAGGRSPLRLGRKLRANSESPILYKKLNGDLVVCTNGRSIVVAHDRDLMNLLRSLSRGRVCALEANPKVGRRNSQPSFRPAFRKVLKFLLEERALDYA